MRKKYYQMNLYAEQSPKQTPDSGLGHSSENLERKIQSKFPYSNHEFLQTCHFLCSNGGFHNAPSISPSAGLLTKQETSHNFKVTARRPLNPCGLSSGGGVAEPPLSPPASWAGIPEGRLRPGLHLHSCPAENFCFDLEKKKKSRTKHLFFCVQGKQKMMRSTQDMYQYLWMLQISLPSY